MEKSKDFQLFMTQNDEQQFCEELRGYNPNIFFLDISPSSEADISKRLYTKDVFITIEQPKLIRNIRV